MTQQMLNCKHSLHVNWRAFHMARMKKIFARKLEVGKCYVSWLSVVTGYPWSYIANKTLSRL